MADPKPWELEYEEAKPWEVPYEKSDEDLHVAPSEQPLKQPGTFQSMVDVANLGVEQAGRALVGAANLIPRAESYLLGRGGKVNESRMLKYGEPLAQLAEPLTPEEESSIPPIAAGAYRSIARTANALTTPEMVLSLPFMASKPVLGALAAVTGANVPSQISRAKEVLSDPNSTAVEKAEAVADPIVATGMTALMAKGARETKPAAEATQPKGENAETIRSDTGQSQETGQVGQGSETNRGGDLQQTASGTPNAPTPQGQAVREVSLTPAQSLENVIRDSNAKANNRNSTDAGLAVKSVDDLEQLATLRDKLYKERQDLLEQVKTEADPAKKESLMNQALILSNKLQLPREAIEVATNSGGWAEESGKTELGNRPLDYNKNPEVADWLEKNAKRTGISFERPAETPQRPTGRGLQLKQPEALAESGSINIQPIKDFLQRAAAPVRSALNFVREIGKEVTSPEKMTDYRRSVLNWSAKLQRSFGEAASIQRDITKQIKDPIRRDAITNWIQVNGDPNVLRSRASQSEGKLAKGYEAALTLTPEELKIANEVKQRYAALERRGQRYDVLNSHKDNYVTQIWDLGKGPTGSAMGRTLKQKFRFSKARTFPSFFEGEQADFVPKTKDISKLLPVYMHEMESVIAARELVEEMSKGTASDGRPLVAAKGVGIPTEKPNGDKATLVMPKIPTGDTNDYKVLPNQPALENWKWISKDDQGNPIFLKADLALHPEAYNKLKNVLGKSAIKEWYQTPTSAVMAIPKAIVHGLDIANSEVKKTMLGVLSPFHQVQEATHAAGHRVNPTFSIPKIDLVRDAGQMDAARHGLMLQPDKASEGQFMEGFKQSKVISKIPGLGTASDWYSNYLFNEYIPGLKYKTYTAILDRNNKVYAKDLAAGRVAPEDVKTLSAEQANAAFGHLNYADLGRNPTIQHLAQLGILAPDFLESRVRFAGQALKGATGLKVGREQVLALATLAIGQASLAYTSAQLTGGQWDAKRPFEMTLNGKRYTIRSVPEDIQKFMGDTRNFVHSRLSSLGKAALQYGSGVNYRGQKVTAGETTKELAQTPIPIAARGFLGIGELSGMDQLAGAVGLKVSKASPRNDVLQQAHDWGVNNASPKIKAEYDRREKESLPDSVYKPLRKSLESNDTKRIVQDVKDILAVEPDAASKEKRMKQILKDFRPFTENDVKPFATHSKENEVKFLRSLDASGKAAYRDAIKEQVEQYRNLTAALYGTARNPPIPEKYQKEYGR